MTSEVWLVTAEEGSYDDYRAHVDSVWLTRHEAEQRAEQLGVEAATAERWHAERQPVAWARQRASIHAGLGLSLTGSIFAEVWGGEEKWKAAVEIKDRWYSVVKVPVGQPGKYWSQEA